jgi:hypothetical protein
MATTGHRKRQYWSRAVTERSDALDLDRGVFTWTDPRRIAASLKRSAERSRRRKGTPYQSAMSMLTFYANRAGRKLGAKERRVFERAKVELRKLFGRETASQSGTRRRASARRRDAG